jgi:hypothetical protein
MKLKTPAELKLHKANETIGFFRSTQIVRRFDGLHELQGGTQDDRSVIHAWCSQFATDLVFADSSEILRSPAESL